MRNEDLLTELDRRLKDQKDFLDARLTGLSGVMRAKFDEAHEQRHEIIEHQKETNSRVTHLECETRLLRWMVRKPHLAIPLLSIIALGIIFAINYFGLEILFKII